MVKGLVARFAADRRGSALAEMAVIMPILVFIILAGFEVGRFALLQQKLNRAAVSMADLVSQANGITLADLTSLYEATSYVVRPFDLSTKGLLIVSSISKTGDNPPVVDWQCAGAGTATATSELGVAGSTATLPTGFTLAPGDNAIYAEIVYNYVPFLFPDLIGPKQVRHRALFRPRFGALTALGASGTPPVNPPTCT